MKSSKVCTKCKVDYPLSEYAKAEAHKDGLTYWCKSCRAIQRRKNNFETSYGLTVDEYHVILKGQDNKCPICECQIYSGDDSPKRALTAHVDHCHDTAIIRGLLCGECNLGVGKLGDTPHRIERALAYVSETVDVRYRDHGDKEPEGVEDTHDRDVGSSDGGEDELLEPYYGDIKGR